MGEDARQLNRSESVEKNKCLATSSSKQAGKRTSSSLLQVRFKQQRTKSKVAKEGKKEGSRG